MAPPEIEPDIVYHYTSIEAMMSIVSSKNIWATSISYLNDVSERKMFIDAVEARRPDFDSAMPALDPDVDHDYDESFASALGPLDFSLGIEDKQFVASFSSEADSLMHWRSYCPHGNGVSIGFRTESLKLAKSPHQAENTLFGLPPTKFQKVQYINPSDTSLIDAEIAAAYQTAQRAIEDDDGPTMTAAALFDSYIADVASLYKHKSFMAESEHRLLLGSIYFNMNLLRFRPTRSTLIPYVELAIPSSPIPNPMKLRLNEWDAIAEIVVGPTTNMDLSVQSIRAFFASKELGVSVRPSDVPYRDW